MQSKDDCNGIKVESVPALIDDELTMLANMIGRGPASIGADDDNWNAALFSELVLLQFNIDLGRTNWNALRERSK